MAKSWLDTWLDGIFDADWLGRRGEKLTAHELIYVRLFGRHGKVLRNVYIPKENGETTEIDVMFITQKGIFVIESKNYSGWIFGDEKDGFWTATLENGIKNKFYNPIKQNRTHTRWLQKYLEDDIPLFSMIVFSERCELKKITVEDSEVCVIKRDRVYASIRNIWERTEDKLDKEKVLEIYKKLEKLTHVSKADKQAHVDAINEKYKTVKKQSDQPEEADVAREEIHNPEGLRALQEAEKSEETVDSQEAVMEEVSAESQTCPRCGGILVLRVAKKGANAGNSFYGCANFPKCRYMKSP